MTETKPTPPDETSGTEITRFNALRHGLLSRYTVLPWEDASDYHALVDALVAEHAPQGPTEEHLVEELAGILWRKRRLRLAEAAALRSGLEDTFSPWRATVKAALAHLGAPAHEDQVANAIRATACDTEGELADIAADEAITRRALDLIGTTRNDAYEAALAILREDTREWWEDLLTRNPDKLEEGEQPLTADVMGLRRFLEDEVLPWFQSRKKKLAHRPLIRDQAFGEALDPDKLERLGRYEVHLDRKFERTLAMLLRLKDLRQGAAEG